jgi:formylglycine-generating enzyme required for sulfatase activity
MPRTSTRPLFSRSDVLALSALFVATLAAPAFAVTIPTVPVGNAGNTADTTSYGAVSYDYRIATTEVTNAQYAAFLNAKAASDPLALYNTGMDSDARGGITRSGVSGSYTYTTKTNMGDKPVNYVSWYDAIRFANWLHNGQVSGDTETGAYTLLGGIPTPSNGLSITRNSGAIWFLTSEDEWYKAAYHQPAAQGGDSDDYWLYPTASNSAPTVATANSVGDISNPGTNVANYFSGADWNSQNGNVTTVASAGPLSESYYGTSDQGGNVWEWNEALVSGSFRGVRGGSWGDFVAGNLAAAFQDVYNPTTEANYLGFRVATVPEPSSVVLVGMALAIGALVLWRKRRVAKFAMPVTALALVIGISTPSQAVTIPTVSVGNTGNAGEVQSQGTFGAVAYDYRIATTEVTNAQYAAFLNAKAASDPLALYSTDMNSDARGGITRSGVSGSFMYTTKANMADKPVNYVSWYDSIRFANWLHNGQGAGDTETGAYTLAGGTATPSNGLSITRNVGATWFLTSEDEWYKAAYHQPGADSNDYWAYPTTSNTGPTVATANSTGDINNPGANVANYNSGADWNSQNGNVTTVGSAGPLSDSFYGTADQGGNVLEWNEALISGSLRGNRGGAFNTPLSILPSSFRNSDAPTNQNSNIGFRVATVPEPGTAVLALVGCVLILWWRKARK